MTSETRKTINKPKAASGGLVGGISYPAILHYIDSKLIEDMGWTWLDGSEQILAAAVAGVLAAISAYRTGSAEPGKVVSWRQRKKARNDWVDAALARRDAKTTNTKSK